MTSNQVLAARYELTGHLARGGMADVFTAKDTLLGRQVAIKILHSQFSSDQAFVKRFRREAQAAANLSHPNIVSIYDWGESDQTYFIVMELVDGRSLRDVLKSEGALLPRRAVEIAAEVATALGVAHQGGLVHRDIKPGNILLTRTGAVKVTDFGIARAWDDSSELTKTGAVIGTATYFSPEQAQGVAADERSDLYSLGVVLYEMLTGRAPFQGDTPVAVAYQHVSTEAPFPSSLNPDVPAEVDQVVMRAMHKDPNHRHQTAEELRRDLVRVLEGPDQLASEAPTRIIDRTMAAAASGRGTGSRPAVQRPSQLPFILTAMGLLFTLGLGVFLLFQILDRGSAAAADQLVAVPNVAGMSEQDALATLQQQQLLVNTQREPSATVDDGRVIRTDPPAALQVSTDSTVIVYVSTGRELFEIPALVGQTQELADQIIKAQGFQVGGITLRPDTTQPAGVVLEQSPTAGVLLAVGTPINLVVSKGPEQIVLADYTGKRQFDAAFDLGKLGLTYEVEFEISEEVPQGFVIRTDPVPGTLLAPGTLVKVIVSDGPPVSTVPNLAGMSVEQAQLTVSDAGFVFRIAAEKKLTDNPNLVGLVVEQFPGPGAAVAPNTVVQVYLGELAPPPTEG
jgi:serine/threonine-protein kinase